LERSCDSVYECFIVTIDSWYKFDGGIGGFLSSDSDSAISESGRFSINYTRLISDALFNIIVCVLLIEILSGIMTDTFAKIRSEQEELNEIRKSR
jgi:hypothetical protein